MSLQTWRLELRRRLRKLRGDAEVEWPPVPAGVFLNPSDADFASYKSAPLALTWSAVLDREPARWQQQVRLKLRELLGIATATIANPQSVKGAHSTTEAGLRRQTIYLLSAPYRHVPITIVWDPKRAAVPLPVMMCLQGHTSGAHISWGEARLPIDVERIANGGDFAVQAVRHGHVAICIEQIAFGERREQALAHRWDHPCIDACNRALLLGRTVLGDRVADVLSVIDWLRRPWPDLPAMDLLRIRAMGNSAGGETALFAAALEVAIEGVIASGCVGAWRKTSGTRQSCPDTVIPGVLAWMEYSDVLALCAPRLTLVVSGVADHIYPYRLAAECAEDARPVFAALNAADSLRVLPGAAGHRFYPDIAWPAFMAMLESGR
jgi:hypothetical protein